MLKSRRAVWVSLLSVMILSALPALAQTDRPTLLQEMIALRDQLKTTNDPLQIINLNAQLAQKEALFLLPADLDFAAAASTLRQPETGLIRLLPRGKYDDVLPSRGAGAYYSFPRQTHVYDYGSDLELQQGRFLVGFAGADYGFLVSLGNVSMTGMTLSTPGIKYLADYNPPLSEPEARAEYQRSGVGFQVDGFTYRSSLPATVNNTFALRSVGYRGSDCLIIFHVLRQDTFDDSMIILWRMLKRYATPQLEGGYVANVTATNYTRPVLAAESIASGFGTDIANDTVIAPGGMPLPTLLGGVSVSVQDSQRTVRNARLFAVAKGQVNYQIPPNTTVGPAIITIRTAAGKSLSENVRINTTAPGIFTATSDGQGIAAASTQRVRGEVSTYDSTFRFDVAQNKPVAVPIDLGPETDRVYLLLYTSGVRFRKDLASVKVTIGGVEVSAEYAGAQCCFLGVDQINALIPRSLIGRGDVDVTLSVDGIAANTVRINLK